MEILMLVVFVLGYAAIAFEHQIKIDKAAAALLIGMICWGMYAIKPEVYLHIDKSKAPHEVVQNHTTELDAEAAAQGTAKAEKVNEVFHHFEEKIEEHELVNGAKAFIDDAATVETHESTDEILTEYVEEGLMHHLFEIASILFFLMGAMTIVELVDAHEGFSVITDKITTNNKVKLLWIVCLLTFFFSAALDNLTTSIVMISVIRKLISDKETRWFFAGFIIIAANAGGAWSPIGDVTTTMLWIGKQLPDTLIIITELILPSLVALLVPLGIASFLLKGDVKRPEKFELTALHSVEVTSKEKIIMFSLGLLGLMFVPVFKTVTHLPPFMGMMLSLGVIWAVAELMHKSKTYEQRRDLSVIRVLQKIDTASVLFFLGILLAVAALQEVGTLGRLAGFLDTTFNGNIYSINISIGILSAIVDNVPLVAAAQGMYDIDPTNPDFASSGTFWQFLAYCAGTGGSALIIGSAAGVAVMGLEKISFGWYLKKISLLALVGYLAGAGVYMLFN